LSNENQVWNSGIQYAAATSTVEHGRCDKSYGGQLISRLGSALIDTELPSHGLKQFASGIHHYKACLIPFRFRPVIDGLEIVAKCQ
jgi:hypothetical protein